MKKRLSSVFFLAVLVMLIACTAIPAAAASMECVPTSTFLPASERTVNGTSFWGKNYKSTGYYLYAIRSGKKYLVSRKTEGSSVISNGTTIYYVAKMAKGKYLYRYTISNQQKKSIGKLCSANEQADLCGYYDGQIFFTIDSPEGTFNCIELDDGDVDLLVGDYGVTTADQHNRYFILSDGTGAGHSYLGVFDAENLFFNKIWNNPAAWYATNYNVYCAVITRGYLPAEDGDTANVGIAKYNYKTGKVTVYAKFIEVTSIISISNKKMVYRDGDGALKTYTY